MIEHLLKFCGSLSHKWKGWFVAPNESSIPYVGVPNTQDVIFVIDASCQDSPLTLITLSPNPGEDLTFQKILLWYISFATSLKEQELLKSIGALLCTYGEKIGPSIEKSMVSFQWIDDNGTRWLPEGLYSRSEPL